MGFLKKIFKKKPGGTFFGNALRGVSKIASSFNLPGAGLVSNLLPDAPPLVVETAQQAVAEAATGPKLTFSEGKTFAQQVKEQRLQQGATALEASHVGAAAFTASTLPPAQAVQALETAQTQVQQQPVNSFGKTELKTILNGAAEGARSGATSAYLNDTELGKAQKRDAINTEGAKIMPWVLGTMAGVIGLLLFRGNK
jgi:hypothetical protein